MKILICLLLVLAMALPVSAAASITELTAQFEQMNTALILLVVMVAVLVFSSIFLTVQYNRAAARARKRRKRIANYGPLILAVYGATILVLIITGVCFLKYLQVNSAVTSLQADALTAPSETEPTEPPTEPAPTYTPQMQTYSDPENWGIRWEIIQNAEIVDSYHSANPMSFGDPAEYFVLEGVSTFRGNNYRNDAAFGTAQINEETLSKEWEQGIGSLNGWPGSGWTGQPLVVRWDETTRQNMNLYDSKKAKEDLVEVILATLDGNVYFYDLEDGTYTRDPINLGMNFKGSGSIDPRGYPIMYVGSGVSLNGEKPKIFIVSLITGEILYEQSGEDAFSLRNDSDGWTAFDSSPLISAETDTLIWPGENGILYTIKLNTKYDAAAGTLSMAPEQVVKTRYSNTRNTESDDYWLGYETSAVAVGQYLYLSENGGMFFCIDLNTMELVWAQDTLDDSNSSPVFAWEDDKGYLYTAPSLHFTAQNQEGYISIFKLDAQTGEIVWEVPVYCHTIPDLSGGVQSSPVLGREGTDLEGLIIYPVARTKGFYDGSLIAIDTKTGEIVWEQYMDCYTWSSPVGVYTEDGKGYIVLCDSGATREDASGYVMLLDGLTGEVLDSVSMGSNVEASPVVFENTIVVGTRGCLVTGIRIE